jgi:hypothetical protein
MDSPTNLVLAVYISFCLCLAGCDRQSVGGEQPAVDAAAELDTPGFEKLLYRVAEGWNEGINTGRKLTGGTSWVRALSKRWNTGTVPNRLELAMG